jgi:gluconolactonase
MATTPEISKNITGASRFSPGNMWETGDMRKWNACLAFLVACSFRGVSGQTVPVTLGGISGIVAPGTPVIVIKAGYHSSEGPMAAPDGSLYFSEPSDNKIYRVDSGDNITVVFDAGRVDDEKGERWRLPALAMDKQGRIFACRRAGPGKIGIAIVYPESEARFVALSYQGKPFVAPNDLTRGRSGGIYFTDPGTGPDRPHAVYFVKPSGEVLLATDNLERPNGILLSRDERTLYVVDTLSEYVFAFDVRADGTLGPRRNFARLKGIKKNEQGSIDSGIDGIALDNGGNVYVISHAGVEVFNAKGEPLGLMDIGTKAQNLAFAGKDGKTLYITAHGSLLKIHMLAQGYRERSK